MCGGTGTGLCCQLARPFLPPQRPQPPWASSVLVRGTVLSPGALALWSQVGELPGQPGLWPLRGGLTEPFSQRGDGRRERALCPVSQGWWVASRPRWAESRGLSFLPLLLCADSGWPQKPHSRGMCPVSRHVRPGGLAPIFSKGSQRWREQHVAGLPRENLLRWLFGLEEVGTAGGGVMLSWPLSLMFSFPTLTGQPFTGGEEALVQGPSPQIQLAPNHPGRARSCLAPGEDCVDHLQTPICK